MCGIFGFWLNRKLNKDDLILGKKNTKLLSHRGPDNQGEWYDIDKGIYLGFRRLSVIDLSQASNQPMHNDNTTLAFNGEIYNFKYLKKTYLENKYQFNSSGDTEVLMNMWKEFEDQSVEKIDGMYAFAVFHNNTLNLVTDYFGEKPLYLYTCEKGIFFSSEASVLIKLFSLNFKYDDNELISFLSFGYTPDYKTGFNNLELIKPATIIKFSSPFNKETKKYWNIKKLKNNNLKTKFDKSDYDKLLSILIESIENRMHSDVPIGLFLSSGLDSSLIAAIIKKELNRNIDSYTVSFSKNYDESEFAQNIANYLEINHKIIENTNEDFYNVRNLNDIYNYPNDNLTALSIYLMSKGVNEKIKVAITGLGGDEAFFGYNKYDFIRRNQFYYLLPFISNININKINFLFKNFSSLFKLFQYTNGNNYRRYISLNNKLSGALFSNIKNTNNFFSNKKNDLFLETVDFERNVTLPLSYILANDHGSMRASLETRTPYLSKKLFEFLYQFHHSAFYENNKKKSPLFNLLSKYLPNHLIEKRKRGFNVPIEKFSLDNELFNKYIRKYNSNFNSDHIKLFNEKDKCRLSLRFSILNYFETH